MARGINKVILIGYVGADPDVRYTPNGTTVCNFSIATTVGWKDKTSGERKENTEWHRIVAFNKLAEIAGEYIAKGSHLYVEGALRTNKWTDKDGRDRYTTEIVINSLEMLSRRSESPRATTAAQPTAQPVADHNQPAYGSFADNNFDDDIPF